MNKTEIRGYANLLQVKKGKYMYIKSTNDK